MSLTDQAAQYIMRGRNQAILVGLLFSILPTCAWIADAIVALVTLRKGAKEGAFVLLWVMLPSVVLSNYNPSLGLYAILSVHLVGYGLALLLRHSASWSLVLETVLVLGFLLLVGTHLVIPDITAAWLAQLTQQFTQFNAYLGDQINLTLLARLAIGFRVALLLLTSLWSLVIGRAFQARLYNPGQLYPELRVIRLSKLATLLMMGCVLSTALGIAPNALSGIPIVALVGGLAGFSVFFLVMQRIQANLFWRILFYSALALSLFYPVGIGLLVILAWIDSGLDLRKRWKLTT